VTISVNRAIVCGHVGADPETKGRDAMFVTFNVATSERWKDRAGDQHERTQWHRIVVYDERAAKFASQYIKRGDKVYIEGQIETRKWEKNPGEEVYITEIVVRPFRGLVQADTRQSRDDDSDSRDDRRSSEQSRSRDSGGGYGGRDLDDEIPFAPEWR